MRGKNFLLLTVPRLTQEREELSIVANQYGTPTWCHTIADTTAHIVAQAKGMQHAQGWWQQRTGIRLTAAWQGFAQAILENVQFLSEPRLMSIATHDYSLLAKRPPIRPVMRTANE